MQCIYPQHWDKLLTRLHTEMTSFVTFIIYHVYISYVLININKMVGFSSNNCKQIISLTDSSQISGGIKA